jgi:hypothetical protein
VSEAFKCGAGWLARMSAGYARRTGDNVGTSILRQGACSHFLKSMSERVLNILLEFSPFSGTGVFYDT